MSDVFDCPNHGNQNLVLRDDGAYECRVRVPLPSMATAGSATTGPCGHMAECAICHKPAVKERRDGEWWKPYCGKHEPEHAA